MKLQRLLILTFVLVTFFGAAEAQTDSAKADQNKKQEKKDEKPNSGILFFKQSSFMLSAPKNWVMDNQAGMNQGLPAVFYPQGSSWTDGKAVMYANIWVKDNPKEDTLQKVIEADVKNFKNRSDKLKVEDGESLPTSDKDKKATVKYFTGDSYGNYEAIAYIDEAKIRHDDCSDFAQQRRF